MKLVKNKPSPPPPSLTKVLWCKDGAWQEEIVEQFKDILKGFRQGSDQLHILQVSLILQSVEQIGGGKIWCRLTDDETFTIIQVRDNGGLISMLLMRKEGKWWAISKIINSS